MKEICLQDLEDWALYNLLIRCQDEMEERKRKKRECLAAALQDKLEEIVIEDGLEVHICATYNAYAKENKREFVIDDVYNITEIKVTLNKKLLKNQ